MGIMPSILYGAACLGLDPTRVDQARVLMASALGGNSIGKDRALRLWILKCDPLVDACTRPLVKWATAVWECRHVDMVTTAWRRASVAAALVKPGTSLWRGIRDLPQLCWPLSAVSLGVGLRLMFS